MRTTLVVVGPPSFDPLLSVFHRLEPVHVQALVAERSVERFDEAVVRGLARAAEVDPHLMMVRPEVEHAPRELAPVVREDMLGGSALCDCHRTRYS